jgi:RNA polymerase sigma-70 factor (ECF subfamily)
MAGAVAELACSESSSLYRSAMALVHDPSEAWDLVQDTFERALRLSCDEVSSDGIRRWLFVTLRNLFIDRRRAAARKRHVPLLDGLHLMVPETTEERCSWRFVDDTAVEACVRAIDPRLRQVYELHVAQGLPLTTIATHLGIPASTAGTRLHRARRQLKGRLERELALQLSPAAGMAECVSRPTSPKCAP